MGAQRSHRADDRGGAERHPSVWHDVGLDDVRSYSPPLADLVAARSGDGVHAVAHAVERVVRMRAAGAQPEAALEVADGSKRIRVRVRPAVGVGALAVTAVTGLLVASNPLHGGDGHRTVPATSRSSFVLPSGSVTIDRRARSTVGTCWLFKGHARLAAGRTLLIGAVRVNPPAARTFYQKVTWRGDDGRSAWWAARFFGTNAGQTYRVTVVAVPTNEAVPIERSGRLPRDAEVERLRPDVKQTSYVDDCKGAGETR